MYKMLIVDDEPLVRKGLSTTIDWNAYDIEITHQAKHGGEALEIIKHHPIDLVVTDIRMPVLDGVEFIQAIKALGVDLNVIVLSGYKNFEYAKTSLESGAFSYLLKPIDNQELIDKVVEARNDLKTHRSKEAFQKTATEDLSKLKKLFVRDVLYAQITDEETYQQKSEQYGVPTIESGTLVYVEIEHITSETNNNLETLHQVLESSQLFKEIAYYDIYMDAHKKAYVHECEDISHVEDPYKDALDIFEKKSNETFLVGICGFNAFNEISKAYTTASKRAHGNPFPYLNHIVSSDDFAMFKPQVKEALQYVAKHYSENITVKTVAEALYVSESYLMHAFKDTLNRTFNEYLTTYRLKKAKDLLVKSHYHVYEIADRVGYGDVKYFSQVFKKHTGMSPREYTKMYKR